MAWQKSAHTEIDALVHVPTQREPHEGNSHIFAQGRRVLRAEGLAELGAHRNGYALTHTNTERPRECDSYVRA